MEIIVILLIIAIAAAVECFLYHRFGDEGLTYTAKLDKSEVMEGGEVAFTEELCNDKPLPLPFVKTEIIIPSCLDLGADEPESAEGLCYVPSVFSLKGRERCIRKRKIACNRRGVFDIGSSSIYGGDLFGLASFSLPTIQNETLTVLPSPLDAEDLYPNSRLLYGDIMVRRFICEDPFMISGAHEYTGREPMNSIFWSATARMGRLMALNKDFTTSSRLLILLSFQRRDDVITHAPDAVCELMIKAAAFALDCGVKNGSEMAMAVNIPDEENEIVTAKIGEEHRTEQLRRLARLEPCCKCPTDEFILNQPLEEYTDIVLITPFLSQRTADLLKSKQQFGQYIRVYGTQNEAETDLFVQITRKANDKIFDKELEKEF